MTTSNDGDGPELVAARIVSVNEPEGRAHHEVAGADPLETQAMRLFTARFEERFRYNHTRGLWMEWTGLRWIVDTLDKPQYEMIELVERMRISDPANRRSLGKISFSSNALKGCQSQPELAVNHEHFDNDILLLGTPTGYVDLRTGEHHKPDRTKMISKATAVSPTKKGKPKQWLEFLKFATNNNDELVLYLQKFLGYCLSGLMDEEIMTFIYGPGGNGKGVMLSAISHILGDYYVNTPASTFMDTKKQEHATELARLNGARLVSASETGEDDKWNLPRIKEVTGNETPISARFMRQDYFEFWPLFKMMIIGNNKPAIGDVDPAIARRLRMIEFTQVPKQVDRHLKDKMAAEYGQILQWMIDGFLIYQKEGLDPPECVTRASAAYLSSEDVVQQFLNEWCEFTDQGVLLKSDVQLSVDLWKRENGVQKRLPAQKVYKRLREAYGIEGADADRWNNKRCLIGLRLKEHAWEAIRKEFAKHDKELDDKSTERG